MPSNTKTGIAMGISTAPEPAAAARELWEAVGGTDAAVTIFFSSPRHDATALGSALRAHFGETPLIGCTTAGEITPAGYFEGTLTGVSLPREHFEVTTVLIEHLDRLEIARTAAISEKLAARLSTRHAQIRPTNTFGFLLVDGLSLREETLVSALYSSLPGIPLFGGSAADGLDFGRTFVFHGDRFHGNSAVFALMQTTLPFHVFKTQHFVSSKEKMVVTAADAPRRIVHEINGEPAARQYARILGLSVADLNPSVFATSPVVVRIGGDAYVRSIQKANADESLTFYCAIDEGLILTLARSEDLVGNLRQLFRNVRNKIGEPQLVLGCDCILRNLEISRKGLKSEVGAILAENHAIGFSTYGEQFNAMHVNQTFTGVAIGSEVAHR